MKRHAKTTGVALATVAILAIATACAGVKMNRASGAHRYRPLPLGTEVKVVGTEMQLGAPHVVIGELKWLLRTSNEQPDKAKAEIKLKKTAAKFGCDAMVGMAVASEAKKSFKKVATVGEGGKRIINKKEVTTFHHTFTARCVRTANAPGGIIEGTGKTAELAAAAKPPVLSANEEATARTAPPTDGKAVDPAAEALWDRLSQYKGNLLTNWKDALAKPPKDEMTVLEALGELMVQITGPAGFWRKTVRTEWFGCPANPDQEQCSKLDAAIKGFGPWERLRAAVGRQTPGTAKGFIRAQQSRIGSYFNEVVPRAPNLTGMQQTGLYMTKLR